LGKIPLEPAAVSRPRIELEFTDADHDHRRRNGTGKSTLLEAIGALAGYDEAAAARATGRSTILMLSTRAVPRWPTIFVATGCPKVTAGWFFRAESFYSVPAYRRRGMQGIGWGARRIFHVPGPHGEGSSASFKRCSRQGIYILDEPESALSPSRQIELLKMLRRNDQSGTAQVSGDSLAAA